MLLAGQILRDDVFVAAHRHPDQRARRAARYSAALGIRADQIAQVLELVRRDALSWFAYWMYISKMRRAQLPAPGAEPEVIVGVAVTVTSLRLVPEGIDSV